MNRYTIPNWFRFKEIKQISDKVSLGVYKDGGFAVLKGEKCPDAGKIIDDDVVFVSELNKNKNKFCYGLKDNTIIFADTNGVFYQVAPNHTYMDSKKLSRQSIGGFNRPEGIMISEGQKFYFLSPEIDENGKKGIGYNVSEAYESVYERNEDTGLRKVVPTQIYGDENVDKHYNYIDGNGRTVAEGIKSENDLDANDVRIVDALSSVSFTDLKFLMGENYQRITEGYDDIQPLNDCYITTDEFYQKNNWGQGYTVNVHKLIDKDGKLLVGNFTKYYVLANGDILVRPLGGKNFVLVDGVTYNTKIKDISAPVVAEKLNMFFAKQKLVPTIFGDEIKVTEGVDEDVAYAVMKKLSGGKISTSVAGRIIDNSINTEPTFDAFNKVLNANLEIEPNNKDLQEACNEGLNKVRRALVKSSNRRISNCYQQVRKMSNKAIDVKKFKASLGASKYKPKRGKKVTKDNTQPGESDQPGGDE